MAVRTAAGARLPPRRLGRRCAHHRRRRGQRRADRRPRRRARPPRRAARRDRRARSWADDGEPAGAPHMLALPIAAAWSAGLLAVRDRGRAPPLALAALMTLWANIHGGFIFGLILIGPFALEALAEAPAGARLATARAWTLFGLAALAAAHQSLWRRSA